MPNSDDREMRLLVDNLIAGDEEESEQEMTDDTYQNQPKLFKDRTNHNLENEDFCSQFLVGPDFV